MILLITLRDWWWLLLALFLGLWGSAWSISVARRRKRENGYSTPIVTVSEQLRQRGLTLLANTAKIGLGVLLGTPLGMGIREHQLTNKVTTYTDVSVLSKVSDREFWIWPDRMKKEHIQICTDSTVGWYAGEILDDWTFEQRYGCKRVISYHEKPKGEFNVNASVQMR